MSRVFYKVYHGNLAFSAIEKSQLPDVIDKTYFPLLAFVEETKTKIGIELNGYSLEKIQELRPLWIEKFKKLHKKGLIELVGSGYMQIIAPLVPYEVNIQNQEIGLRVYESILGTTPQIAYVNEQVFSKSLIDLYKKVGYKAIMMEWNNAYAANLKWKKSYSFQPIVAEGVEKTLPLIWTDSIMFQQFQRTVHDEQRYGEYVYFLSRYLDENHKCVPIYSSDLEIFNYRPGRFETEAIIKSDEWNNIAKLSQSLKYKGDFLLPSEVLKRFLDDSLCLDLTTASNPIITKKQDKYSLSRWAACGMDSNYINTLCYRYFLKIRKIQNEGRWKLLLHFWGSDYRTHTTKTKWKKAIGFLENETKYKETAKQNIKKREADVKLSKKDGTLVFEKDDIKMTFLLNKGLALESVYDDGTKLPFGTIRHGELSHISPVADFFTGLCVIESASTKKITDLVSIDSYDFCQVDDYIYEISTNIELKDVATQHKSWTINLKKRAITLSVKIALKEFILGSIRIGSFSMFTKKQEMYYECKNGGDIYERYLLGDGDVNQQAPKSLLQSSRGGLGVTDGTIVFKNKKDKIISIKINQKESYPFIMLQNHIDDEKQLTRIYFSLQELDDTLKSNQQKLKRDFSIEYEIEF